MTEDESGARVIVKPNFSENSRAAMLYERFRPTLLFKMPAAQAEYWAPQAWGHAG
jgi:hypothetical protein